MAWEASVQSLDHLSVPRDIRSGALPGEVHDQSCQIAAGCVDVQVGREQAD
jgi:hypothetical protein